MVDLKKLTTFTISEKRKITFTIDGKEIVFEIPFVLGVNPERKRLYVGNDFDFAVDLSIEQIEDIINGNESILYAACKEFAWNQILKNKFHKED